jgi:hypothetical protein
MTPAPLSPPRRAVRALLVLAWVAAVVLAATVAWRAVAVIGGDGRSQDQVLSQAEVAADLAALPLPSTAPAEPTTGPSSGPSTQPSTASPTPPTDPEAAEVARVWPVTGGEVAVLCRGAAISLTYATPADGWSVEVKDDDGAEAEVRVEFRRDDAETRVRAGCVDGVPTVEAEDHGNGED